MSARRSAGETRRTSRAHRTGVPRAASAAASGTRRTAGWTHPALWSALAALLLYAASLPFGFVWDDHGLIENNVLLRSASGLWTLLRSDFGLSVHSASGLWRPLVTLSYAIDGALWHGSPAGFRAMNVLAHAAASALVALLALQSGAPRWGALLAGLWFAAMPAHVESVAWISGRTDVYCTLFALATLLLDRRARRAGARWPGVLPLATCAAALLSKEVGIVLVGVLAVAEWIEPRRAPLAPAPRLLWLAPYAAISALYVGLHMLLVHAPQSGGHLASAARSQGVGAALMMLPANLAFLWPGYPHSAAATLELPAGAGRAAVWGGALATLAMIVAWVLAVRRRHAMAVPLGLWIGALLPNVVVNLAQGYLIFGERYVYLPSAGASWALALALAWLAKRGLRTAGAIVLGAALVAWSAGVAGALLPAWASDEALFRHMTIAQPNNYMGRVQWARQLADRGRDDEAMREIQAALALDPGRPEVHSIRALIASRHARWDEAQASAERAIALGAADPEPRLVRVVALLGQSQREDGSVDRDRLEQARLALEPLRDMRVPSPAVEALWGQYLIAAGRNDDARAALALAVVQFPSDPDLAYTQGLAESASERFAQAAAAFERAVAIKPGYYEAWLQLAIVRQLGGDVAGARQAVGRAAGLPAAADGRARGLEQMLSPPPPVP